MNSDTPAMGDFAPHDVQVEQSLLSTVLNFDELLASIAAVVDPSDFYDPLHARIFEKMLVLDELERPITPRTLHAVMKNDPGILDLKAAWDLQPGQDYLGVLADVVTPISRPSELAELARIVVAHRQRRDALEALADATESLERGNRVETSLAAVVKVADMVALAELQREGSPGIGEAFERLSRDLDSAGTKDRGLMTGWRPFDKVLGGFQPESFDVVAGRPGMGKSIVGTNLMHIAGAIRDDAGERVYDPTSFSLEMSQSENVARLIAEIDFHHCLREGRSDALHYSNILKNRMSPDQYERYVLTGQTLGDFGIDVYDKGRMHMGKIRALARARAALNPKRKPFILIDHLQIVGAGGRYKGNRIEELTEITGLCKDLAKQLKCPVVGLSQLSRGVESREDKRPVLSDLRESGSIEQDADSVIFLYRPEYYLRQRIRHAQATKQHQKLTELLEEETANKGRLDVDIAKNRHGAVGDCRLFIDVASGAILGKAPGEAEDDGPQQSLSFAGADPLDELARRTGQ